MILKSLITLLWPVRSGEYAKFLPIFFISFLTCFNYYILRIAKDTVLITAPESGAEALPFIKVWGILPSAFLMTFCFTRLSNLLSRRTVFYAMIWIFIAYFLIFIIFLYPYRETLTPIKFTNYLAEVLPSGFRGFIAIIRNWTLTTFYIMSEMWSCMIVSVIFWGFVNDMTSVKDAKRFYGLFYLGTSLSGIFAGMLASTLSTRTFNSILPFGHNAWDQSITLMNLIVIGVSLLSMLIYWYLNQSGLGYTKNIPSHSNNPPIKMGIRKNFAFLAKSHYLTTIAILVISFNIVLNLTEVVWKDQVKQLHPSPADFNRYMSNFNFWVAVISSTLALFVGNLIRFLGWTKSALIPPILCLIAGLLFSITLICPERSIIEICIAIGTSPLSLVVFLGSLQGGVLRSMKYSLIDATKEMAFTPLPQESKIKGKSAIDGLVSRLGKSGGAMIYQGLLITFGSIMGSIPIVTFIILFSLLIWVLLVRSLGKQFHQLTVKSSLEDSPLPNLQVENG